MKAQCRHPEADHELMGCEIEADGVIGGSKFS